MNKSNRPTEAHRAPFYPAIVRLLRLPPPPALSTTRQSPIGCEMPPGRSWPVPNGIPGDEQPFRLCGDKHLRHRRDG